MDAPTLKGDCGVSGFFSAKNGILNFTIVLQAGSVPKKGTMANRIYAF
jgi:hypothetical protein